MARGEELGKLGNLQVTPTGLAGGLRVGNRKIGRRTNSQVPALRPQQGRAPSVRGGLVAEHRADALSLRAAAWMKHI